VDFLQNHDQIGNRAFGERLTTLALERTLALLTSVLLLSPHIPMLFMGEEYGERCPFYFFTDFQGKLAKLVREGRRNEFKKWPSFQDPDRREQIPDPNAEATFAACVLDWDVVSSGHHAERLEHVRSLLRLRATQIVPRLAGMRGGEAAHELLGENGLRVTWKIADGALVLLANFGPSAIPLNGAASGRHKILYESAPGVATHATQSEIAPWSVSFLVREADVS
jgi:maltooligosyltrehalose trehalohydrolase